MDSRNDRVALLRACFLLFLGSSFLLAPNAPTAWATDTPPTLAEIAKANDAAWNAIQSVDMEFTETTQCVENGKMTRDMESTGRWSRLGHLERLREYPTTVKINTSRFGSVPSREMNDSFCDGDVVRHLRDDEPENKDKGGLSCQNSKGLYGDISPKQSWARNAMRHQLEPLRYFSHDGSQLTLSKIIASWKVTLDSKPTVKAGDVLWRIHAEYPTKSDKDKRTGSYLDIYVNANKAFLIQEMLYFENNTGRTSTGRPVGFYTHDEIQEFCDCGHGTFFPKKSKHSLLGDTLKPVKEGTYYYVTLLATKLSVNATMAGDAFDFRFPENLVVQQTFSEKERTRFLIWGPDNKPAKVCNSCREFNQYLDKDDFERLSRRVQKNLASKKPADLVDRSQYYMQTKKYDEAVALCSEVITAAPKTADAENALVGRAYLYLFYQEDFGKAIADYTELLNLAKEGEDMAPTLCFRGLAYANQQNTLDKAVVDFSKVLSDHNDWPLDILMWMSYSTRSAIRIRQGDCAAAMADINNAVDKMEQACSEWKQEYPERIADAYAIRSFIFEKQGNRDKAAADRETAKHWRKQIHPGAVSGLEADMDAAIHRCLVRLVPTLEKP